MYVIKRNNMKEPVSFDKIKWRIENLSHKILDDKNSDLLSINPIIIAQKVINGIYDGVKTTELDNLAAETAAYMSVDHPDYGIMASRISISNLQKQTDSSFTNTMKVLYDYIHPKTNEHCPLISKELYEISVLFKKEINSFIDYSRDFNYDFFGFKTLQRAYLIKTNGEIRERPQHMLMRVSLGIHGNNIQKAFETYDLMSNLVFTHASPTLFNCGTPKSQNSSCFLVKLKDDSIEGIFSTLKDCAHISKHAGGIGLSIHDLRASNSFIKGTNGTSSGIVPFIKLYNDTARAVNQGGKRNGSFSIYLEPWHADIFEFLELKKNTGKEEQRARDLFYALWIPDLFMKRVEENGLWSLMCPHECPGLSDCWGDKFEELYTRYESEGKYRKQIKAQDLWRAIIDIQIETGTPYMLYKDHCNRKSNQQNLGTIKSSNLCSEIVEFSSSNETSVCNLSSIALNKFVKRNRVYDYYSLYEVTGIITRNLNKIIDINYYPVPEAKNSNMKHRPIGIGVQGLADTFALLKIPFDSEEASILNKNIFETIYYGAVEASMELAKIEGPYSSFKGSPMSKGIFQFDMWDVTPDSGLWDWDSLKRDVVKYGVRNSLLVALMPTASTSQIMGNYESFEPCTSNIYTRRVLSGEFMVINKHLLKDLIELGIWNYDMKNMIIANKGSVQNIEEIPQNLKDIYKTVWEIKQRVLVDMAVDRGAYIDQSQSFNVHMKDVTFSKMTSLHFYTWKLGLKTGMYYLRTRPSVDAIQFTVDKTALKRKNDDRDKKRKLNLSNQVCTMEDGCINCGS